MHQYFLFMAEKYSILCVYHILFTHLFSDEHVGCSHLLATVISAAMNLHAQVFFLVPVFNYLGYIPSSRIAGHMVISCLNF